MVSLDDLEQAETGEGISRIERGESQGAAMRLRDLSVTLDDGTGVVKDAEVVIEPRRAGPGGGRIRHRQEHAGARNIRLVALGRGHRRGRASGAKMLLMPQRAYVPVGRCAGRSTYPEPAGSQR